MKQLAVCGYECRTCPLHGEPCQGCRIHQGRVFWTKDAGMECCPIYDCAVHKKGLSDCAPCGDLPCKIFTELRDPSMSDEAHQESIRLRLVNLGRQGG